jgi:uroporphyrinogen-III decarboxylase
MDKEWSELTPEEKREARFKRWLEAPGVNFKNEEAKKNYQTRVTRLTKAIRLEEPDRVPVRLPASYLPAFYAGGTLKTVMYDYEELKRAWRKFREDFADMDTFGSPGLVPPAKVLDYIDFKLEKWPGHGLPDDAPSYQFVEDEYMKADEYDALIKDPSDFWLRTFLPRTVGALESLKNLSPITPTAGTPVAYIARYGRPDVQAALQILMDAGKEALKWQQAVAESSREALEAGYPSMWGGFAGAPFDTVGDFLRGTRGIMMDMYRQPDRIHEAMERMTPFAIDAAIASANASGCPVIVMPLHKGTGGFMSLKQFETFYWPTFKRVMMGLINEGIVPMPFAEGNYITRLEIIKDMPRASTIWWFEQMDMTKAKEVLGDTACISGNVPITLLCTGTPQEVKEYCRKLIEVCAPGGGYILSGSASMNKGNAENLRVMMEAAREYGTYQ